MNTNNKTIILFLSLTILFSNCRNRISPEPTSSPNVLFLAIDDLNTWLGCLDGHPNAKTPHLDRLAARGTLFTNAHCQAPICGPSRASLMTGLRPSTTGIYGQINDQKIRLADSLLSDVIFLPQYFQQAGYKTMGKGKLFHHFAPEGVFEERGGRVGGFGPKPEQRFKYDPEWFDKPPGTQTDWGVYPAKDEDMIDYQTAQWAIERLQQEHDRPFFLAAGFIRPHVPFYAPQHWFDLHPLDSIQLPPYLVEDQKDIPEISVHLHEILPMPTTDWAIEQGEWKAIVQAYLACISFVDHYVGTVLDALEASPYADNTVVVVWSDHGYHLGEKNRFAKHSLWEEATRVPLIFAGPGIGVEAVCNQPVELLDLYPTLLDLCGLQPNPQNEGKSLSPLLKDPIAAWTKPAITTYGRNNHGIRTDQHRFIQFEDGSQEFYDHVEDPNEWNNLAEQPGTTVSMDAWKQHLPSINKPWSLANSKGANAYLEAQRQRDLNLAN